ncbi:MAG: helix-turn-helix transcriptional regulator [Pseudodonghicola sp.]
MAYSPRSMADARGQPWLPTSSHANAIIRFIEWSQAHTPLELALEQIVTAFDAEFGALCRVRADQGRSRVAVSFGRGATRGSAGGFRSFAADMIGLGIRDVRVGAVLRLSEIEPSRSDRDPQLSKWMARNKVSDAGLVCLRKAGNELDFLEIYFSAAAQQNWYAGLEQTAPSLVRAVESRRPGLITEALARRVVSVRRKDVGDLPILSLNNPAGLTRTEWRVCVLASRGLAIKAVCNELGVSRATVRTHLKHIYMKTGLENFHMLARRLVSPAEQLALRGGYRKDIA